MCYGEKIALCCFLIDFLIFVVIECMEVLWTEEVDDMIQRLVFWGRTAKSWIGFH